LHRRDTFAAGERSGELEEKPKKIDPIISRAVLFRGAQHQRELCSEHTNFKQRTHKIMQDRPLLLYLYH